MNKRQAADKHNYERWLRLNARLEQRMTKEQKIAVAAGRMSRALLASALASIAGLT